MTGITHRLQLPRAETAATERRGDAQASGVLGALLGALGMSMAAALVVAVLAATGGIRSGTAAPSAPGAEVAAAPPAAVAPAAGAEAAAAPVTLAAAKPVTVQWIGRSATAVPPAITRSSPATVQVDLRAQEAVAEIEPGVTYSYMTFDGTVPGPMIRVRVGDTVVLTLHNPADSKWPHSIDLHAVTGAGGGSAVTQTAPGKDSVLRFKALKPGLFVYHCASAPIPMHIADGMYGLILVEPEGGLPKVDHEYYVMQAELYTNAPKGVSGQHEFSAAKADAEQPDYMLMNGRVGALTGDHAMTAKVGDTVRIYFGVGGFQPSSLHLIGEQFDTVNVDGGSLVNHDVQTTLVPAGGATMATVHFEEPGTYTLLDHTITRAIDKGALAQIVVSGTADPAIYSGTGQ